MCAEVVVSASVVYVWHDSLCMTHFMWHDSLCVTWLILCDSIDVVLRLVCAMAHCAWHDSFYVTRLMQWYRMRVRVLWCSWVLYGIRPTLLIFRDSFYITWLIIRDMTHFVWHDSFYVTWFMRWYRMRVCTLWCSRMLYGIRVTLLIFRDSFYVTWLIIRDMTHCVWHDSFYVTWLMQ